MEPHEQPSEAEACVDVYQKRRKRTTGRTLRKRTNTREKAKRGNYGSTNVRSNSGSEHIQQYLNHGGYKRHLLPSPRHRRREMSSRVTHHGEWIYPEHGPIPTKKHTTRESSLNFLHQPSRKDPLPRLAWLTTRTPVSSGNALRIDASVSESSPRRRASSNAVCFSTVCIVPRDTLRSKRSVGGQADAGRGVHTRAMGMHYSE